MTTERDRMAEETAQFCYCGGNGICYGCEENTKKLVKLGWDAGVASMEDVKQRHYDVAVAEATRANAASRECDKLRVDIYQLEQDNGALQAECERLRVENAELRAQAERLAVVVEDGLYLGSFNCDQQIAFMERCAQTLAAYVEWKGAGG